MALRRTRASRTRRRFGGYIVHLGIVSIIVAIAASSTHKLHTSGTVKVGESLEMGGYKIRFDGLSKGEEPHRTWTGADVTIIGSYVGQNWDAVTASAPQAFASCVQTLMQRGRKPIVVACGNPYLLQPPPWVGTYLFEGAGLPVS